MENYHKENAVRCVYDGSPCVKLDEESFPCCIIVGRDGRIRRMCRKFKESKDYATRKDMAARAILSQG